jgi:ATPase subunit of ABC transporter with duplicated ATPase domains
LQKRPSNTKIVALLIDKITNNIDLKTKKHITQVLREYPGAMIIISHDSNFLEEINITTLLSTIRLLKPK